MFYRVLQHSCLTIICISCCCVVAEWQSSAVDIQECTPRKDSQITHFNTIETTKNKTENKNNNKKTNNNKNKPKKL